MKLQDTLAIIFGGILENMLLKKLFKVKDVPTQPLQPPEVPTTEVGVNIPVLFGTRMITDSKLAWYGDILIQKEEVIDKGGKKG